MSFPSERSYGEGILTHRWPHRSKETCELLCVCERLHTDVQTKKYTYTDFLLILSDKLDKVVKLIYRPPMNICNRDYWNLNATLLNNDDS